MFCTYNNFLLKLIVATEPEELGRLDELYERAKINNVPDVTMIPGEKIKDIEPHCQVGASKGLVHWCKVECTIFSTSCLAKTN